MAARQSLRGEISTDDDDIDPEEMMQVCFVDRWESVGSLLCINDANIWGGWENLNMCWHAFVFCTLCLHL